MNLIAQTTQGDYPKHVQTALIWIGAIAAVLGAFRLILWPQVKELLREVIKEIVGFRRELQGVKDATKTNATAVLDIATKMNDSPAVESPDPTKIAPVATVAIHGTGDGSKPA